jgi:lipoate-protein ligase A
LGKATYKVKGGKMINISVIKKRDEIQKIKITGDFFLYPEESIEDLEEVLLGKPLNEQELSNTIRKFMEDNYITILGASPEDLAKCILMAGEIND